MLKDVKGGCGQWSARCPAHDDRHNSLSIKEGKDGKTVLHCHAGCSVEAIAGALGLNVKDLFVSKSTKAFPDARSPVVARYIYPTGAEKLRRADKSFMWRRPDGRGGWIYNRQGIPYSLYVAGELSGTVIVCEGEKDADNVHKLGFNAVSGADGAGKGKWRKEYTDQLRGLNIYILQDNDSVGMNYAIETATALNRTASKVKVLDLSKVWPEIQIHGDISDMIDAKGAEESCAMLSQLMKNTPEWKPPIEEQAIVSGDILPAKAETFPLPQAGEPITTRTVNGALQSLGISLKYNQLLKETEVHGLPPDYSSENAVNTLPVYLMDILKVSFLAKGVTRSRVDDCLGAIADQNRYNPIDIYLKSGEWDGIDRFQEIYRILGVSAAKHQTYIRKWFVQCVALGLNDLHDPVGAEGVLVLQGEQGIAKTSFFRIITPFSRWFTEGAVIDMGNKDTLITALSGWITELGELDSTLKREQASLKAFITRPEDRIRIPYAKNDTRAPRRTSFCGTVNPKDYLKDDTGSRRFWTVPLEYVDKKALFSLDRNFVDQLWFQVYQMYLQDKNGFRLTETEMNTLQADNHEFDMPLPFELEIKELLNYSLPVNEWEWWKAGEFAQLLQGAPDYRRIGRALKKIANNPPLPNPPNPPYPPQTNKMVHGNTLYLLPMKHIYPQWGD